MPKPSDMPSLIPELYVTSLSASLDFYVNILGFRVVYDRPEDGFAMLERQGSWLMLDQIETEGAEGWISGALERPFGRGINLSIDTTNAPDLHDMLIKMDVPMPLPLEEKWYRAKDEELGVHQFIVLDPDGYMLRFSESLGTRRHTDSAT